MSPRFRLSSILRARKAQEDAAKGGVMRARSAAAAAAERVDQHEVELQARMVVPAPSAAAAFVAAMAARRAVAAELSVRRQQAEEAQRRVGSSVNAWSAASQRHRMVEKLAERHETARREADAAAEQRAVDDLSTTRRPRTGGLPAGGSQAGRAFPGGERADRWQTNGWKAPDRGR